eukprot:339232-Chlamydomonas_euryale.AAC.1
MRCPSWPCLAMDVQKKAFEGTSIVPVAAAVAVATTPVAVVATPAVVAATLLSDAKVLLQPPYRLCLCKGRYPAGPRLGQLHRAAACQPYCAAICQLYHAAICQLYRAATYRTLERRG